VKHDFRAENPDVLSESLSIGRQPLKWLECRRTYPTFLETPSTANRDAGQDAFSGVNADRWLS
jgi:hypothetical protein